MSKGKLIKSTRKEEGKINMRIDALSKDDKKANNLRHKLENKGYEVEDIQPKQPVRIDKLGFSLFEYLGRSYLNLNITEYGRYYMALDITDIDKEIRLINPDSKVMPIEPKDDITRGLLSFIELVYL